MNIADHIERGRHFFPHKPALIFEGEAITYEALDDQVNRAANGLKSLGIGLGDRVALFLPNVPEFVYAYLGALKIGAIAVAINTMLKQDEVRYILNDCGAKVLVTMGALSRQLPDQSETSLIQILTVGPGAKVGSPFQTLLKEASSQIKACSLARETPATIIYTSGTTGFPKGAVLSHGNVIANSYAQNRCCRMRPDDKLLLYLPLFHCFGQNAILNSGLNAGATLVMERMFQPEQILKRIAQVGITMFFGVPTVFILLLEQDLSQYDLSSLRFYFAAGAPLPAEIAQRWQQRFGVPIHEGYGLTESSPCATYNHDLCYNVGSIGSPVDNVEVQIVDPTTGTPLADGEIGEIILQGPNVMLGYWNKPEATAKAIRDGWLYTGDLGYRDQHGYFYIVDRLKDMINLSGLKVYPAEVENVLYQHPAVAEAAVYGVPETLKGEIVQASIRLNPKQPIPRKEDIIAFCSERMATYKVPRAIEFVESLPKNPTGKILKRRLREMAIANQQTPDQAAPI